jgi:prolyl oligopeptidase
MEKIFFLFLIFQFPFWMSAQNWVYPTLNKGKEVDTLFGVPIDDEYKILETTENPITKKWLKDQDVLTKDYFKSTQIDYFISAELAGNGYRANIPLRSGKFYFKFIREGDNVTASIFCNEYLKGYFVEDEFNSTNNIFFSEEDRLISPQKIAAKDLISFRDIKVSRDNRYAVFTFSRNGSDKLEAGIINMDGKELLEERLTNLKFAQLEWYGDGFYYTKLDTVNRSLNRNTPSRFQKVYYHRVGTSQDQDKLVFERPSSPEDVLTVQVTEDKLFLIIYDQNKIENTNSIFLKNLTTNSTFYPLYRNFNKHVRIIGSKDSFLFAVTNFPDAHNGAVVEINTNNISEWQTVIPESKQYRIDNVAYFDDKFTLLYQADTQQVLKVVDVAKNLTQGVVLNTGYNFRLFSRTVGGGQYILESSSFFCPPIGWIYDVKSNVLNPLDYTVSQIDPTKYQVLYCKYKTKDSTEIPIYIAYKKDTKIDGSAPCLLESYGGYGIYPKPYFRDGLSSFLDRGGVYAFANVRGGDYIRKGWHETGALLNKQNSFDDFFMAAKYLVEHKYAHPKRLAITGIGHGGLVVAASVNQHPEMYRVAIPQFGLYDILRYNKYTNGVLSASEFGDIRQELHLKNIFKYSPLQNVKKGSEYPAMLIVTAENDERAPFLHSLKYVAKLQNTVTSSHPILIRVEKDAGHYGAETWQRSIREERDFYAFLFKELGIKY